MPSRADAPQVRNGADRRAGRHRHGWIAAADGAALPPIWRGARRRLLVLLVLAGFAQALSAGVGAHVLHRVLRAGGQSTGLFWLLVLAAVAMGLLKAAERIVVERLSQHYVHELRLGLVEHALSGQARSSVGVTVARATNDLSAVKNWVAMGIAPVAVGVPVIAGTAVVLAMLYPALVIAIVVPMALLAVAVYVLTPPTFASSRAVRRARGRLSGQLADTVLAAAAVRSGGGLPRELRRLEGLSRRLVDAAIARARYAGALRGCAAATVGLVTAFLVGIGVLVGLPSATLVAALTVVGFVATPIHDLGRVAEYRQAYRAARRAIGPALPAPGVACERPVARVPPLPSSSPGLVRIDGLDVDGRPVPTLQALPGDRVVVDCGERARTSRALANVVGLVPAGALQVQVDGTDLSTADHRRLRALVGYAAQGLVLGRGTISRTVRYRAPDSPAADAYAVLQQVGLGPRIAALPDGIATVLRSGGDPLTVPERARLQLARALLGTPPLLVLDHLDDELGDDGRAVLRRVLRAYPGVVLIASERAAELVDVTARWGGGAWSRPTLRLAYP